MIHNPLEIALIDISGGLGFIGKVYKIEIVTGHTGNNFRSRQTKTIQNKSGFGSRFALGNSFNIKTSLTVQIGTGNSRNNAVTVRVLMT